MQLRPYQIAVVHDIRAAWATGARNVLVQLATGGGKTAIFAYLMSQSVDPCIAIAHRVELVSQISITLGRYGIQHNLIAQRQAIRDVIAIHMAEFGRSFYDPHSRVVVAGVDTLIRMAPDTAWFKRIKLVVQDEGHHPLLDNKWGRAAALFPNANGLYPTATPIRADGRGLGRHADGIMDAMVIGVGMRELIRMGYLTDYRIFAPSSDLDLSAVTTAPGGDFSPKPLRAAIHKSHITGDVVAHYQRIAPGQPGVTFAVDIEAATDIAAAFRAAGVPAEVISSKTPDLLRSAIMRRFRNGELLQLVNVDLLGEGVDVPAISVVSMARPTASYGLYSQQFGRSLRPMPGKTHAKIIDHVGNVIRHGLPDAPRAWSLDRRDRRAKPADDVIPLRVCLNPACMGVYPRTIRVCPNCGFYTPPQQRSTPAQVDGDLTELDPSVLAALRGEIDRIDGGVRIPQGLDAIAQRAVALRHTARQQSQHDLRMAIAQWAGWPRALGVDDSGIYRQFYHAFGIDIGTAQTLGANAANDLCDRVKRAIDAKVNTTVA